MTRSNRGASLAHSSHRSHGIALAVPLLLLTAGQLSAALSGRAIASGASPFNIYTLALYCFLGARGVSWVLIVRYLSLSFAYPVMSLGYCLVPLAAALFLGEDLSWGTLAGMILVTAGVALIGTADTKGQG
ncbi:DMT family transporter [Sediminispirochaeta smaragdinae]|uniref:Uncharacterized protein n=1 Tax=Sediminispirochaeta smaragdinae (strain DSM 11293 / JCM 15392 / SEBR 4228) TaxID=573413 RepID=E1R853_SEDSS|nr:EamA family transporter [Sediminispirochaeta smaragdinae]ADK82908.1 protein of unknown function DUF6 transmembrane [Sediminispirochaeta smaragdinae DSM 11293]